MSKWEKATRFVITAREAESLQGIMEAKSALRLMKDRLMERTLFSLPGTNSSMGDTNNHRQIRGDWLRVRQGEVDRAGETTASLAYKRVGTIVDDPAEVVLSTVVDSYNSCVELLQRIGLVKRSVQQNRRTSYFLEFEGVGYMISVDWWPGLDEIRFVSVRPDSSVDRETLQEFCTNYLNIPSNHPYSGGVDDIYEQRLGKRISDVPRVTFRSPPKAQK